MSDRVVGKLAQAYISVLGSPVGIDGIIGKGTRSGFAKLKAPDQKSVLSLVEPFNEGIVRSLQGSTMDGWLTLFDLQPFIVEASLTTKIPDEWISKLIRLEAAQRVIDGERVFDPRSRNGQHLGLTQMSRAAWLDGRDFAKRKAPSLRFARSSYNRTNAFDPELSIQAAACFGGRNREYASRLNVSRAWSFELFYMMHNQGLGFVKLARDIGNAQNVASKLLGSQSGDAKDLAVSAAEQVLRYS